MVFRLSAAGHLRLKWFGLRISRFHLGPGPPERKNQKHTVIYFLFCESSPSPFNLDKMKMNNRQNRAEDTFPQWVAAGCQKCE